MPDTTLPLDDLTQQFAQRRSELERLRQEIETRQTRLTDLEGHRAQLRAQLQQVEADIQVVIRGSPPAKAARATPTQTTSDTFPTPKPPTEEAAQPTLADTLVEVARAAGRPLTAKQLAEELVRRQFPTNSSNFAKLVEKRVTELVKQGVLRRAQGRPGVVLGSPTNGTTALPKKAAPAARRRGQPSIRSLLTDLLQKSRKPVAVRELVEQVLATGYRTSSKNFARVVGTALGELEGVENVKGQAAVPGEG